MLTRVGQRLREDVGAMLISPSFWFSFLVWRTLYDQPHGLDTLRDFQPIFFFVLFRRILDSGPPQPQQHDDDTFSTFVTYPTFRI
jgi:hypothetical protein